MEQPVDRPSDHRRVSLMLQEFCCLNAFPFLIHASISIRDLVVSYSAFSFLLFHVIILHAM